MMAQFQPEVMPVLCPRHAQPQLLTIACAVEVAWLGENYIYFSYVFTTKLPDRNNLQKECFIWAQGFQRIQSFTDREDLQNYSSVSLW